MAFANKFMAIFKAITPYIHTLVNSQHFFNRSRDGFTMGCRGEGCPLARGGAGGVIFHKAKK
jgi:hypothetical protein